jgi:four helix bundle protein
MLHKDLNVWKVAMELVKSIYLLTNRLPETEKFGLISQLKRASVSIPANIAEGAARNHDKENIQFCYISLGSIAEVETLLILSNELYQVSSDTVDIKLENTRKLLLGYIKHLKSKSLK